MTNINDPRYVKALSHPLRVRILALLQERTASPRELAEWLDATLGTVSYHVRTLHDFGLIELVKTTQVRGAIAHHYKAKVRPRVSDEAWASAAPIVKQAAVGAALQTVDDYARASAAAGGFDRAEAHLSRTNLRLDAKGWQQAARRARSCSASSTGSRRARPSASPRTRTPTARRTPRSCCCCSTRSGSASPSPRRPPGARRPRARGAGATRRRAETTAA